MWIKLEDAEIAAIVAAVGEGAIANRLLARPSIDIGAFVAAAEEKTRKRVSVEEEGVIDRRAFGAYVMCWMWISERDAGLPMSIEPFYLSDEAVSVLKAIPRFHVEDLKRNDRRFIINGKFGDHSWTFVAFSKMWWVHIDRSGTTEWLHSEKWLGQSEAYKMSDEEALLSVANAMTRASPRLHDRRTLRHSLTWRRPLDQYVLGEISKEVAQGFLDSTLERVEADAVGHRLAMRDLDSRGSSFWGPVYSDEWSP